jgi:glycosyltransferase involved in cell wall biosynthesis
MSARRGIQDAQPPHPQDDRTQFVTAFVIRTAVNQPPEHALNQGRIWVPIVQAEETGDPTHAADSTGRQGPSPQAAIRVGESRRSLSNIIDRARVTGAEECRMPVLAESEQLDDGPDGRGGRMTRRPAPERLTLVYLGDPNSIHTRRWLAFFAARGHSVHLLVPSGDRVDEGLDPSIAVHRFLAWPRSPIRGVSRLLTMLALRLTLLRLRPDVLHAHFLTRYGWAARLSGFRPYVITVWGSDVFVEPAASSAARMWARRTLSRAALVTAVSEDLARAAVELGARPDLTRIVQFGIDPDVFAPGPAPADLRATLNLEGCRVVLSPRGLRPIYRHEVAIRALVRLPQDVVLVIVKFQPDPDYLAVLERLVADLGLVGRVRFAPPVSHEHMADMYRLADVVVSVPRSDAFSVTALEAMACGTPIVVGELPSAHEVLDEVDPDAIVPGDDPIAIATAIEDRLALSPGDRADLGRRLRAAAIERADVRRNLLQVEGWYRILADGTDLD